jgi:hypothetical protein
VLGTDSAISDRDHGLGSDTPDSGHDTLTKFGSSTGEPSDVAQTMINCLRDAGDMCSRPGGSTLTPVDDETGASALRHERLPARHRWWSLVFGVAGVLLLPWIVILYFVQPRSAAVGDLPLAATGAILTIALGLLVSAAAALVGSPSLVMTTTATGVIALCTGFFHLVTGTAYHPHAAAFTTVLALGPIVVLCGAVAWRHAGAAPLRSRSPVLAAVLVAAALAAVLAWTGSRSAHVPVASAYHLKVTWMTLDVAEATTLLATAVALRWRPVLVPAVASAAGALLFCDVWFNVVGAIGEARTDAIQLAVVSIPLGVAAFAVGAREVRHRARGR